MKKHYFLLFMVFLLSSCSNDMIEPVVKITTDRSQIETFPGVKRIKFNSRVELQSELMSLRNGKIFSRSLSDYEYSDNELPYKSLIEANIDKIKDRLTDAELNDIMNDPDELSFCPDDSVIADMHFAQLLNENREIQIGDTVYRYIKNGVLYGTINYQEYLDSIQEIVSTFDQSGVDTAEPVNMGNNIFYVPIDYGCQETDTPSGEIIDTNGNWTDAMGNHQTEYGIGTSPSGYGIPLPNGITIQHSHVRTVNFSSGGDGDFMQKLWTGIWGKSVQAINYFQKDVKMILNLYRQNYIIYSKVGVKIRLQKKKGLIWCNMKAQDMALGWDMVELLYRFKNPVSNIFPVNDRNTTIAPIGLNNPSSMGLNKELLLFYPYDSIMTDKCGEAMIKEYNRTVKSAKASVSTSVMPLIIDASDVGTTGYKLNEMVIVTAPFVGFFPGEKSKEINFEKKKLFGTLMFIFDSLSLNGQLSYKPLNVDDCYKVGLGKASVFGAVKYKERWLGARIFKNERDND